MQLYQVRLIFLFQNNERCFGGRVSGMLRDTMQLYQVRRLRW